MNFWLQKRHLTVLAVSMVAYAAFLIWYMCPYAGGADSSGYLNSARLISEGRLTAPPRIPEGLSRDLFPTGVFSPAGFRTDKSPGQLTPTYPVGLPLHFAAAAVITGFSWAPVLVNVTAALGCLGLVYALARQLGLTETQAATCAALFAVSPLTLFFALQPMSDLPATFWALVAIYGALRSDQHRHWAALTGLAFAVAVLIRPTNGLLVFPLAVGLGLNRRSWLFFLLGGLPGAGFLACYNAQLYGTPFASGYQMAADAFGSQFILPTLLSYARWLPILLTPLVLAILALPFGHLPGKTKRLLLAWGLPFAVFYAAYFCTHEDWWYLRFLLPVFPALLIGSLLVVFSLPLPAIALGFESSRPEMPITPVSSRTRITPVAMIVVLGLAWQFYWCDHFAVHKVELGERAYRDLGCWVETDMPANALIAADQTAGAIFFYSQRPFLRWDLLTPQSYAALNDYLARNKSELYAGLFPYEEAAALQAQMPGRWEPVMRFRQVTVWRRVKAR